MPGILESSVLRLVIILVSLSQFGKQISSASSKNARLTSMLGPVNAALVTLYRVNNPGVGDQISTETVRSTVAVTALGPGASGMTRYQEVDVYTRVVLYENGRDPSTIISTPVTKTCESKVILTTPNQISDLTSFTTVNFQQGPSRMQASTPRATSLDPETGKIDPASSIECSLNLEQQSGECIQEVEIPVTTEGSRVSTSTVTTTYIGNVEAFATIDVPNFAPSTKTITAPPLSNTAINSRIMININVTVWRSNKLIQVLAGIGLIVILCRFFIKD